MNKLNESGLLERKETVKMSDLKQGEKYLIIGGSKEKTKFGPKVLVELENFKVYLPERMGKQVTAAVIRQFRAKTKALVYRGTKDTGKPNPAYLVEIVDADESPKKATRPTSATTAAGPSTARVTRSQRRSVEVKITVDTNI